MVAIPLFLHGRQSDLLRSLTALTLWLHFLEPARAFPVALPSKVTLGTPLSFTSLETAAPLTLLRLGS